jgi:hypothetical protein
VRGRNCGGLWWCLCMGHRRRSLLALIPVAHMGISPLGRRGSGGRMVRVRVRPPVMPWRIDNDTVKTDAGLSLVLRSISILLQHWLTFSSPRCARDRNAGPRDPPGRTEPSLPHWAGWPAASTFPLSARALRWGPPPWSCQHSLSSPGNRTRHRIRALGCPTWPACEARVVHHHSRELGIHGFIEFG